MTMGTEKDSKNNLGDSKELELWLDGEGQMVREDKESWASFPDSQIVQQMM